MDRISKQLYSLTDVQFTRLAEQRTHDKQTQQAFAKFKAIASQGGKPRAFLSGFSEFSILDENVPANRELLKNYGKAAIRYRL